jgi:hypothetical protein
LLSSLSGQRQQYNFINRSQIQNELKIKKPIRRPDNVEEDVRSLGTPGTAENSNYLRQKLFSTL